MALKHYPKISSVRELPPEPLTAVGQPSSSTQRKVRARCGIWYKHFKMEGLHTIQQLLHRNDLITEEDLSNFYMHVLIGNVAPVICYL